MKRGLWWAAVGILCGPMQAAELFLSGGVIELTDGWRPEDGVALLQELGFEHTDEVVPLLVQFDGPVQAEWRVALEAAGAQIQGYVPDFAFLAQVPVSNLAAVAQLEGLNWLGEYRPGLKISPDVVSGFGETNLLEVTLVTFAPEQAVAVSNAVTDAGGTVTDAGGGTDFGTVRAEVDCAVVSNLIFRTEVQWVELYVPLTLRNDVAAQQFMNVTNVWNTYGLSGAGQIIGHADTGLDIGSTNGIHPDLSFSAQ